MNRCTCVGVEEKPYDPLLEVKSRAEAKRRLSHDSAST